MTTANYFGWTDDRASERFEKRKAQAIAYEVFNASTLTDEEIAALDAALEACATDPAHILNAEQFPFDSDSTPKSQWELFAEAQDKSFNRRYYNNPDGKPEFYYKKA